MRKLMLVAMLALVPAILFAESDQPAAEPQSMVFPYEIATLLSSTQYVDALNAARAKAPEWIRLKVYSANVVRIGSKKYAYIGLRAENVSMWPSTYYKFGSIVGEIQGGVVSDGDQGKVIAAYFKPTEGLPKSLPGPWRFLSGKE